MLIRQKTARAPRALFPLRRLTRRPRGPGTAGERELQRRLGTGDRAAKFYRDQVSDHLTGEMKEFVARMEMAFIGTAGRSGECDVSFRAGPPGFIRVLDCRTIAYPEYRGNGVMASLGNMAENPHIGILLIDFTRDLIGLHINGGASIVSPARMAELDLDLPEPGNGGRRPLQWVLITVTEAYVHCSKHIPKLVPQSRIRHWGTDNPRHKGGDFFGVAAEQAGLAEPVPAAALHPVP
jgi:uncharacterized protein